jgi:hypothetical protein
MAKANNSLFGFGLINLARTNSNQLDPNKERRRFGQSLSISKLYPFIYLPPFLLGAPLTKIGSNFLFFPENLPIFMANSSHFCLIEIKSIFGGLLVD